MKFKLIILKIEPQINYHHIIHIKNKETLIFAKMISVEKIILGIDPGTAIMGFGLMSVKK